MVAYNCPALRLYTSFFFFLFLLLPSSCLFSSLSLPLRLKGEGAFQASSCGRKKKGLDHSWERFLFYLFVMSQTSHLVPRFSRATGKRLGAVLMPPSSLFLFYRRRQSLDYTVYKKFTKKLAISDSLECYNDKRRLFVCPRFGHMAVAISIPSFLTLNEPTQVV